MGSSAKRLRLWNWLAIVAMLFSALAPGVSHALAGAPSSESQLTAVCTATGMKFVRVDVSDDPTPQRQAVSVPADCPFCLLGAHGAAPPVERLALAPAIASHGAPAARLAAMPVPARAWHSAQPRAPPVSL